MDASAIVLCLIMMASSKCNRTKTAGRQRSVVLSVAIAAFVLTAIFAASRAYAQSNLDGKACSTLGATRLDRDLLVVVCISVGKRREWVLTGLGTKTGRGRWGERFDERCTKPGRVVRARDAIYACAEWPDGSRTLTAIDRDPSGRTTTTTLQVGTSGRPFERGTVTEWVGLKVTVLSSDVDVMRYVCAQNYYNEGCDPYTETIDNNAKEHWIRFDLRIKNTGDSVETFRRSWDWAAVVGGRIFPHNLNSPTSIDSLYDLEITPGTEVVIPAYLLVPKSYGTTGLMFALRRNISRSEWTFYAGR
jgi:hypothetical protein